MNRIDPTERRRGADPTSPRPLALLLSALTLVACRDGSLRHAEERARAALERIPLAQVSSPRLAPPAPRLRVFVGESGIDMDSVALLASWKDEDRAEVLRTYPEEERAGLPFVHEKLVRIDGWHVAPPDAMGDGLFIRPLGDALAFVNDLHGRHADIAGGDADAHVNVYVHRDAPWSLVLPVFASCGSSHPVVRGPSGEVALPIQARGGCGKPRCSLTLRFGAGITVRVHDTSLASRQVRWRSHSAALDEARKSKAIEAELQALDAQLRGEVGLPDASAPPPPASDDSLRQAERARRGIVVLDGGRTCPSVPHKGDLARLRALLADLLRARPDCDDAWMGIPPEMRWEDVATLASTGVDAGLSWVHLGLGREPDGAESDCSDAITADELTPKNAPPAR